jgi:hypothetical protein
MLPGKLAAYCNSCPPTALVTQLVSEKRPRKPAALGVHTSERDSPTTI